MCDTLNIAHRGARSLAPENTLSAARKAFEVGAEMWELDVGMTSDGVLILVHDESVERTSNASKIFPERRPWFVHELSIEEIRRLDFGSWFNDSDPFGQIAAGEVSDEDMESYLGEPAPTLREALRFTRDSQWRVNVEIKDLGRTPGDRVVVEEVISHIEELGMVDRVLVSSFNHDYLRRARSANSAIATGVLLSSAVREPAELLRQLDAQAYNPGVSIVQPNEIRELREQGFEVFVWTVNSVAGMRRLVQAGASGIFTDFPQLLKPILDKRK